MVDTVTIGASTALRSVREPEQGIYEYLEEQRLPNTSTNKRVALPVCLKGWLWRREGLGIFHRYRRRFCVFQAQEATLWVYSDEETEDSNLLQHLVLTRVTLTSRTDRIFLVQGYLKDQKETSGLRARSGFLQSFDILNYDEKKEERFKAVSAKACSVWTHCFKYHMKSYTLRKQKTAQEGEVEQVAWNLTVDTKKKDEETQEMEMDPNFVFEDASKCQRRCSMAVSSFRGSMGSGLFSNARLRSRRRAKSMVRRRESVERSASEAPKSASHQVQFDQTIVMSRPTVGEKLAKEILQGPETELVEEQPALLMSDLPYVSSIWEDEELLSHHVDYNAIVKKERLAAGACGEVWRAIHRSQEVVVKNLLEQVIIGAKLSTCISGNEVSAVYRHRRAILGFIEEIRIMSRLEHSRIVEFRGVALSSKRDLLLVMEYLPRGDLKTFLGAVRCKGDKCSGLNGEFQSIWTWTKHQWRLAIDIIEGLVYLHSLNPPLVHGDIKSANVLLRSDLRAKVTDFGLSCYLFTEEDKDAALAGEDGSNANSSQCGSRAYGTGRWMAPELIQGEAQSSIASDVYAFGIVLSEIDTCALPFNERARSFSTRADEINSDDSDFRSMNENALVHRIVADGWKPTFRVTCPEAIKKLALDCLVPDPSKRPTSLAVAYRLRQAAQKRERPEILAAQAKTITSLYIH